MKLADYRRDYYELSGKASTVSRHLAFAGIALIWAFRTNGPDGSYVLVPDLYLAGVLISLGLLCDLLQYLVAALIWGTFANWKERNGVSGTTDIRAPRYLNWPGNLFWFCKIALVFSSYVVIVNYLGRVIVSR